MMVQPEPTEIAAQEPHTSAEPSAAIPTTEREWAIWNAAIDAATALLHQGPGFSAHRGVAARRKLDRQLAEARGDGQRAAYRELVDRLPLIKQGGSLGPERDLAWLMDASERGRRGANAVTARQMIDALRFADAGLVQIEVRMPLSENSIPPRCAYFVTLTERGVAFLASAEGEAKAATPASQSPGTNQ